MYILQNYITYKSLNDRATSLLSFDFPLSINASFSRKWLNDASLRDDKMSGESEDS